MVNRMNEFLIIIKTIINPWTFLILIVIFLMRKQSSELLDVVIAKLQHSSFISFKTEWFEFVSSHDLKKIKEELSKHIDQLDIKDITNATVFKESIVNELNEIDLYILKKISKGGRIVIDNTVPTYIMLKRLKKFGLVNLVREYAIKLPQEVTISEWEVSSLGREIIDNILE